MKLPIPSAQEVRWTFYVAALCALAITATVVWGIVHKVSQSDSVLHIAVANADQVQRLSEQLDRQDEKNRDTLRKVRLELRAQRASNRALLAYLRAHGLAVPKIVYAPRSGGSGGGGGTADGPSKRPAATSTEPTGPGKSGTHANSHADPRRP